MNSIEEAISQGRDAYKARNFDAAAEAFLNALNFTPDNVPALFGLGNSLLELKRDEEALPPLEKAITFAPGNADISNSIGVALRRLRRYREAIPHLKVAADAYPDQTGILTNLANAYRADHQLAEAAVMYHMALEQDDKFTEAYAGLGTTLRMGGRLQDAKELLDRALSLDPGHADARFSRALLYLEQGNFTFGFADFEQRWQATDFPGRNISGAEWRGDDPKGKTILVHAEQGFGDTIQFARYLPLLAERGARILFYVQPELLPAVTTLQGVSEFIPAGSNVPAYDAYVAVMSLPFHFGTVPATIPKSSPYLSAAGTLEDELERLVPQSSDQFRIGFTWAGRPNHTNDRHRSCPLSNLGPLLKLPSTACFSLQKDPRDEDGPTLENIVDLSPFLNDFGTTANILERLDLVVSVDTATAHLAGALGRPVWLMLAHRGEWRWALERDTSPWYPSMRIFRQSEPGNWATLAHTLETELKEALHQRA